MTTDLTPFLVLMDQSDRFNDPSDTPLFILLDQSDQFNDLPDTPLLVLLDEVGVVVLEGQLGLRHFLHSMAADLYRLSHRRHLGFDSLHVTAHDLDLFRRLEANRNLFNLAKYF